MNELTQHIEYALAHLTERTVWRALIDHHEELLELEHPVAVRAVAILHRSAKNERELAEAAYLLSEDNLTHADLQVAVHWHTAVPFDAGIDIIVVAGSRPPQATTVHTEGDGQWWHQNAVLVGARFIISTAQVIKKDRRYFDKLLARRFLIHDKV